MGRLYWIAARPRGRSCSAGRGGPAESPQRGLEGRALEADRLTALLNFRTLLIRKRPCSLAARGWCEAGLSGSEVVNIDRGSRDGIRRDMGVITPDGVVGKILSVYPDTSQVLLLGDKESGVGALLADTADAPDP